MCGLEVVFQLIKTMKSGLLFLRGGLQREHQLKKHSGSSAPLPARTTGAADTGGPAAATGLLCRMTGAQSQFGEPAGGGAQSQKVSADTIWGVWDSAERQWDGSPLKCFIKPLSAKHSRLTAPGEGSVQVVGLSKAGLGVSVSTMVVSAWTKHQGPRKTGPW